MGNIIFSQLIPITDNMLEFLDKNDVKNIINSFSKQYSLHQDMDEQLKLIVDEYQPKERYYELPQSPIRTSITQEFRDNEIELTSTDSDIIETFDIIDK